jgi:hypothetical protein
MLGKMVFNLLVEPAEEKANQPATADVTGREHLRRR